jgi:hypothetical protein
MPCEGCVGRARTDPQASALPVMAARKQPLKAGYPGPVTALGLPIQEIGGEGSA